MIKCNRCGKMTPAGAVCQSCGAPLSSKVDNGFAPRMGGQDQSELPAWLESLRAGERAAAPVQNQASFSTADFIEEGSLPNWMRSERNARENTASNPPVSARPNSQNDQAIDQQYYNNQPFNNTQYAEEPAFPAMGLTAQSLIDENSLPSWMQEGNKQTSDNQSNTIDTNSGPIAAASLVQPDAMPDWMKSLHQQQSASLNTPSTSNSSPFNAAFEKPEAPTMNTFTPGASGGFSAHDLIDKQSLPAWMQQQAQPEQQQSGILPKISKQDPYVSPAPSFSQGDQQGFAASSLLDVDSLPQWLRESNLDKSASTPSAMSRPTDTPKLTSQPSWPAQTPSNTSWSAQTPSNTSWPTSSASMQTPPASPLPQQNGLAASSFIDPNALPQWLRTASEQPQAPAPMSPPSPKPGSYGVPHRAENVRVPNRPRGANPNENSEVAANVFASMLGVASSSPNFSSPQANIASPQAAQQAPNAQTNNPFGAQVSQSGQISLSGNIPNPYGQQSNQANTNTGNNPFAQTSQADQTQLGYGQMNQSGQLPNNAYGQQNNAYGQPNQPAQMSNPYGQPNQPGQMGSPYGQSSQAGQMNNPYGQSNPLDQSPYGQPNPMDQTQSPYGQMSQSGQLQNNAYGQQNNAYGQPNQPSYSGANNMNMGNVPNTPSMPGAYSQNYGAQNPNAMGNYGNNSYAGNMPGQPNGAMGGNPSMSGMSQYGSDQSREQKNTKKRGLFGAFLDWFSR